MKRYLPLTLFCLLAIILLYGLERQKTTPSQHISDTLVGNIFPEFKLPALSNSKRTLSTDDLGVGQPYLLNVWATWCPTCYLEHPYLLDLHHKGVRIVGLNYKDDTSKAQQWLDKLGNPYVFNIVDKTGTLAIDLGVTGAPETYLIDADNYIRYKREGDLNKRVWETEIEPLYWRLMVGHPSAKR